jgi:hypothetical protein
VFDPGKPPQTSLMFVGKQLTHPEWHWQWKKFSNIDLSHFSTSVLGSKGNSFFVELIKDVGVDDVIVDAVYDVIKLFSLSLITNTLAYFVPHEGPEKKVLSLTWGASVLKLFSLSLMLEQDKLECLSMPTFFRPV